jgi:hypothetical protein
MESLLLRRRAAGAIAYELARVRDGDIAPI